MALISIEVKIGNMASILQQVSHIGDDLKEPMAAAGSFLLGKTMDHFEAEMGPAWSGGKWAELSEATKRRRRKGKKQGREDRILQDTGRLRNSVTPTKGPGNIFLLENMSVTVGTNVEYAGIHQYGGVIYCKPRDVTVFLRTTKSGKLKSQKGYPNLAVFAKRSHKLQTGTIYGKTGYYKIIIPARPFLWLSEDDEVKVCGFFSEWIKQKLGGTQ